MLTKFKLDSNKIHTDIWNNSYEQVHLDPRVITMETIYDRVAEKLFHQETIKFGILKDVN